MSWVEKNKVINDCSRANEVIPRDRGQKQKKMEMSQFPVGQFKTRETSIFAMPGGKINKVSNNSFSLFVLRG